MSSARSLLFATASLCVSTPLLAQHIGEPIDRSAYPVIDAFEQFVPFEEPAGLPSEPNDNPSGFVQRGGPPAAFYSSGIDPFTPISYFTTEPGHLGIVDDYLGTRLGDTGLHLTNFAFIGGAVSPAMGGRGGRRMFIDFFDGNGNLLSGFIWNAPSYQQGARFIPISPAEPVMVDNLGFVQISGAPGVPGQSDPTTMRWWYTGAVQVGSNDGHLPADSTYPNTIYAFQVFGGPNIPAPSGLGLVGVCGLFAARRRR